MKVEMKTTMADKIQAVFSCNESEIQGQRDKALLDIDTQILPKRLMTHVHKRMMRSR